MPAGLACQRVSAASYNPSQQRPARGHRQAFYAHAFFPEDRMPIVAIIVGIQAIAIVAALSLSMAIYL